MVEKETRVKIHDDFYRDSIGKVILAIMGLSVSIFLLLATAFYLYNQRPAPITFQVGDEWRIVPTVPVDQPYLSIPDLVQWVSDVLPKVFVYDFNNYNEQVKKITPYFTPDGYKVFLNQLNIYANYNNVQKDKVFVNGAPAGAPIVLNQGLLSGRYAWRVQMPIEISYVNNRDSNYQTIILEVYVVRVPTLNNISGVAIDNVIVSKKLGNQS